MQCRIFNAVPSCSPPVSEFLCLFLYIILMRRQKLFNDVDGL
jgi:hypothetical protein